MGLRLEQGPKVPWVLLRVMDCMVSIDVTAFLTVIPRVSPLPTHLTSSLLALGLPSLHGLKVLNPQWRTFQCTSVAPSLLLTACMSQHFLVQILEVEI